MHVQLDERQQLADYLVRPIREGKPELGWAGDPDLVLVFHRIENRWELLRHQPLRGMPNRHVIERQGPIGKDINEGAINLLIQDLVSRDTSRRGNSHEEQMGRMLADNDKLEASRAASAADATAEALGKFYHAAANDMGVPKTTFAF